MSDPTQVIFKKDKLPPGEYPLPVEPKHPLRFAIREVTETVPNLKKIVAESEIHPGLKSFLSDELDKITSNGAEINLHDVEHVAGGFNLHISVVNKPMGAGKTSLFKRAEPAPAAPVATAG